MFPEYMVEELSSGVELGAEVILEIMEGSNFFHRQMFYVLG